MVDNKYAIAYSEILEILKHIPIEDYNKIPKDKIEIFETYANKEYNFEYDPQKTLKEQNVSNITKGIIILLFRDYWAIEMQKNKIIAKQNYDRMKLEEKKKEKVPKEFPRYFCFRGVAQLGRALRSGRRGRRFKSCHLDHFFQIK